MFSYINLISMTVLCVLVYLLILLTRETETSKSHYNKAIILNIILISANEIYASMNNIPYRKSNLVTVVLVIFLIFLAILRSIPPNETFYLGDTILKKVKKSEYEKYNIMNQKRIYFKYNNIHTAPYYVYYQLCMQEDFGLIRECGDDIYLLCKENGYKEICLYKGE